MSVYTPLSADNIAEILANYHLGALQEFSGITAGTVNSNFALTTTSGRYVLTLFEVLAAKELGGYLRLQQYLAKHGVLCPEPVADLRGELLQSYAGKPVALMPMVEGETATTVNAKQCQQIGLMMAKWHLASAGWQEHLANPFNHQWLQEAAALVMPSLPSSKQQLLQLALAEQTANQDLYRQLPRGAIHADIFRDNVLFLGGRLTGIIDFYYACTEPYLWDLGVLLNDWCFGKEQRFLPEHARAILSSYQEVRTLSELELSNLAAVCRQIALRFWLSRLQSEMTLAPSSSVTIKDPEEFARKLEFFKDRLEVLE